MNENLPALQNEETGLSANQQQFIQPMALEDIELLHDADTLPFDLMSNYWSPTQIGEKRNVLFDRVQTEKVVNQMTGEVIDLECAFFYYQEAKGDPIKVIRNGSKLLVGTILAFNLPRLAPLEITYTGKQRNKNNGNFHDSWSIKPKRINVTPKQ